MPRVHPRRRSQQERLESDRTIIQSALDEFRALRPLAFYSAFTFSADARSDLVSTLDSGGISGEKAQRLISNAEIAIGRYAAWLPKTTMRRSKIRGRLRKLAAAADVLGHCYREAQSNGDLERLQSSIKPLSIDDSTLIDLPAKWGRGRPAFEQALDQGFLALLSAQAKSLANSLSSTGKDADRGDWWLTDELIRIWTDEVGILPHDTRAKDDGIAGCFQRWVTRMCRERDPETGKTVIRKPLSSKIPRVLALYRELVTSQG